MKDSLYTMINSMTCIIDFEQSTAQDRFIVKSGFLPELDESKVTMYFKYLAELQNLLPIIETIFITRKIKNCSYF